MTDWIPLDLLQPAFKAVRKALRDLEPEDIPVVLRRIAGQSGRRLPPPLARKLAERLDEDEWLRDKAAEAGADLDPNSPDPARAVSALFLFRPEGWEERAREAAEHRAAGAQQDLVAGLKRSIADLQQQLEAARRKEQAARQRAQDAEVAAEKKVQAARAAVDAARAEERAAAYDLQRAHQQLTEQHDMLVKDLEEASERITLLRDELLRARRAAKETSDLAHPQAWAVRDPLAIARLLDEVVEAVRPDAVVAELEGSGEDLPPAFSFPPGIGPDGRDAVTWLTSYEEPFSVIVDGYNVTFLLEEENFTEPVARRRLNEGLARFRRMAAAPTHVIVVYDSEQSGGVSSSGGPGGIEVRFTETGLAADEEILALAERASGRVAVITTDRRVREGAEATGALGLWSQALVEWIEAR
jgi:predicted RNA-binding protein with PIN domain